MLACLAVACSRGGGPSDARADLVLVTIDTLRADHVGCYGHARETTPCIDRLAAAGARFELVYAPASATSPSHATLFSGRLPTAHGLVRNGLVLDDGERVLAEALREAGYRTAAFVSAYPLKAELGFGQGFDHFDDDFVVGAHPLDGGDWESARVDGAFARRGAATADAASAWLERVGAGGPPVFLWVHLFDPHKPYDAPAPFARRFDDAADDPEALGPLASELARYDEEVRYADAQVERVLAALERTRGERERLVVVTSDHGEAFFEHGHAGHNRSTFDEELRVPLVVWWPKCIAAGTSVRHPAHLVDVPYTLASLLGVPWAGAAAPGQDLAPHLLGDAAPDLERPLFLQRPYYPDGRPERFPGEKGWGLALRRGRWKYFEAAEEGRRELYDLGRDPGETVNRFDAEPDTARELAGQLDAWRRAEAARLRTEDAPLDPELQRALRALGYADEPGATRR